AAGGPAVVSGFTPIFHGKDLSGWEGDPAIWSVKDGAITGVTTPGLLKYNKFLIWKEGKPKNFELKASFRVVGDNNSGVQYRSKVLPDAGEYVVGGYQADIHPAPNFCGMLYDERGRGIVAQAGQKVVIGPQGKKNVVGETDEVKPTKLDEWNELVVIARGNHLVHKLNGRTIVDIVDHQESERELEGILALQVHAGPPMTVQFRSIALKNLPDGGLIAPGETPIPDDAPVVDAPKAKAKAKAKDAVAKKRLGRPVPAGPGPEATSLNSLKTVKGFKVELVHQVPRETEGSWVSMTFDPKGRLIASDQYGKLFRITPSKPGGSPADTKVEPINVDIGEAQGLLWAFDSLYVVVNRGQRYQSGLYRATDTNGDGDLDKVEMLRALDGGGEHGPHAVILSPDGKSLTIVGGNATRVPELSGSMVPKVYGEDNLIPHMTDGAGFMRDEKAPGGWVCQVSPDGKNWTLMAMGFRNQYDVAYDKAGELFTYDSDMEWDMNLPWYRPTRVCHVVSGADFGYRNGSGKFPTYYLDSLPPVVNVGPGSPTGIVFGYGAKFPAKYQNALYICDWSYGKLYAVHLTPDGSTYSGELEEFVTGTPLPLTDLVVSPNDGTLYFAIGGRRATSGLYRVVYEGPESTEPAAAVNAGAEARETRRALEAYHGKAVPGSLAKIWPALSDPDRFTRFAARVALEWQPVAEWKDKALAERDPEKAIPALLALTRVSAQDPAHRREGDPAPDPALARAIFGALGKFAPGRLSEARKLDLIRVHQVALNRFGIPDDATSKAIVDRFDPLFPASSRDLNRELAEVLVTLRAPDVAERVMSLLAKAPTQEEQIDLAKDLRTLDEGWSPAARRAFLEWTVKSMGYKGGNSFPGFMKQIRDAAVSHLSAADRAELKDVLEAKPPAQPETLVAAASRPHVKDWTLEELVPLVESGLHGRDFSKGRELFAATACFACHRFANEGGGAGPDLTGLAGRYNVRDLLESIVHPSKVISDQYAAVQVATTDGQVVTGRIVNLAGDGMSINTNMLDPNLQVRVDRNKIEEMRASPVSMMPEGLLNTLNKEEILDLIAYLTSRGDRDAPAYRKP
ncbi:MAG: family 16 glycoside hydrolase, partial [Isosphaeraceae bacterium]